MSKPEVMMARENSLKGHKKETLKGTRLRRGEQMLTVSHLKLSNVLFCKGNVVGGGKDQLEKLMTFTLTELTLTLLTQDSINLIRL